MTHELVQHLGLVAALGWIAALRWVALARISLLGRVVSRIACVAHMVVKGTCSRC